MGTGLMPQVSSWMLRRLQVVVLPLDDGPAISTILTPLRAAICSAMAAIFFSCSASLTFTMLLASPCSTAALNAPTVPMPRMSCQRWCSLKISNILS